MGLLEGKVAIVTGAGSGIGRETAARLSREGAKVVVADVNLDGAKETVSEIAAAGGEALAQLADISSEDSVREMAQAAVDTFGALHCLHNNAADTRTVLKDKTIAEMPVEVWDQTMAVNLRGTMLCIKHALPHMIRAGGGSIVNASSLAARLAEPLMMVAYGASKAGIETLTRYTATQYGRDNIRCNAIAPGIIATPATEANDSPERLELLRRNTLTPKRGKPADIAGVVAFLMSDEAAFITGEVITVDGGLGVHGSLYANMVYPS